MKLLVGALVLATSAALDAKLQDVVCEEDLPLSITSDDTFKIVCPGSDTGDEQRCSFRGDNATLTGNCKRLCMKMRFFTLSHAHMTLSHSPLQLLTTAWGMPD